MQATSPSSRYPRQNHLSIHSCMIGTLSGSCSRMNLTTDRPSVMCRLSSLCAEKPKLIVDRSPLKLAPLINGTNSKLVRKYSKLNEIAVMNSNGPADRPSSKNDFGTDRYHTRSCIFGKEWNPP